MNKSLLLFASFFISSIGFSQDWEKMADLPSAKHHPVTFSLSGNGYSVTGWDEQIGPSSDFYRYDPVVDSWSILPDFPGVDRSFAIGYTYNNKGYFGFGTSLTTYLRDIWEYDPDSETWQQLTTCPCSGRRHPALLIHDSVMYVGMGDDQSGDLNDWWQYDMSNDQWFQLDNLPAPARHHPFQFVVDEKLYVGMGHGGAIIYDDWYTYNYADSAWETLNDFPGESRVAGTQFDHGGYGYVLSGDGSNHSFMEEGEFWQYDPADDSWLQMSSHPGISIWAPGSFVIADTLYFISGQNRQTGFIQPDSWKHVLEENITGISIIESGTIKLFPNPASTALWFEADFTIESIVILDISGRVVRTARGSDSLNVSDLKSGIYFANVTSEVGQEYLIKWIKK